MTLMNNDKINNRERVITKKAKKKKKKLLFTMPLFQPMKFLVFVKTSIWFVDDKIVMN